MYIHIAIRYNILIEEFPSSLAVGRISNIIVTGLPCFSLYKFYITR